MTKLLLVRHGQTVDNLNKIMQGQTQGQLTAEGIRQAEEVRDRLKSEPINVFISSDLKRSVDTCTIIAEPHDGATILQTPLLRERDWGGFTGRFIPSLAGLPWPKDVETEEAMRRRATDFLDRLRHDYPGATVLAVGHGIINKMIQSVYYGKPMREIPRMENAEVRILNL